MSGTSDHLDTCEHSSLFKSAFSGLLGCQFQAQHSDKNDVTRPPARRLATTGKRARVAAGGEEQIHHSQRAPAEPEEDYTGLDNHEPGVEPELDEQARSNFRAEDAWRDALPELQTSYIQQLPQQQQLQQQLAACHRQVLQATVEQHGSRGCPACGHGELRQLHTVELLIIDLACRFLLLVPVWSCTHPDCGKATAVEPLQLSCWPSNAVAALDLTTAKADSRQVWFTLRLMEHADLNTMIVRRAPMYRYCQLVEHFHASSGFGPAEKRLDVELGQPLLQFSYLQSWLNNPRNFGAALPEGILADCGGCWRRTGQKAIHSLFFDFCFKLPHWRKMARNWCDREPPNKRFFLSTQDVRAFQQSPGIMARVDVDKDCSDFNAAEVVARRSDKYDVTAVGVVTCRHGRPVAAMDIDTGERYCYATQLLSYLLAYCHLRVLFVWYDINCRWAAHFLQWVGMQVGDLKARLDAALETCPIRFPLPVFHQHAHSASCQRQHSSLRMEGAGRSHGEPTESLWAVLGEHGWSTQYMHLHNRRGRLERALEWIAEGVAKRLPTTLVSMFWRAYEQRVSAVANIVATKDCLRQQQDGRPLTDEQVAAELAAFRSENAATSAAAASASRPWQVDWVELKLKLFYIEQDSSTELPGISITFADGTFRAAANHAAGLVKKLRSLERKHVPAGTTMPQVRDPAFTPYLDQFIAYEVGRLRGALRLQSVDWDSLNRLHTSMAGRPRLQKQVKAQMARTDKALVAELDKLKQLLSKGLTRLPAETQLALANCDSWTVQQLKQGLLWEVVDSAGGAEEGNQPPTATVHLQAQEPLTAGRAPPLTTLAAMPGAVTAAAEAAVAAAVGPSHAAAVSTLPNTSSSGSSTRPAGGRAGRLLLLARLDCHVHQYAQAQEEIELVVSEMEDCLALYPYTECAIGTRLQQLGEAVAPGPPMLEATPAHCCSPLQGCTFDQGVTYHLQQRLSQAQELHAHAEQLFQPVLDRRAVLLGSSSNSAAGSNMAELEDQLQMTADIDVDQEQQLILDAALGLNDGLDNPSGEQVDAGL